MKKTLITLLTAITLIGCGETKKQTLGADEPAAAKQMISPSGEKVKEDTISIGKDIHYTSYIENPKAYFRLNNKYKDWDKNDERKVVIGFVSEKDGSTSHVNIKKGCGIEKLDNEALRLVKEMKYDEPAVDIEGNPIRAGGMAILVFFPPQ